ncbi:MAG: polyprenyl synthetase family protein [Desulfotalea sp.]
MDEKKFLVAIKLEAEKVNSFIAKDIDLLRKNMEPLLCDILEYGLLTGGKRVRPLLCLLASRLCGKSGDESYQLAKAFEYLHAATLFHDDIIDGADQRRGKESVAKKYGISAAILAGDFLHARAMKLVGTIAGVDALTSFCTATSAMVDGEFLQLRNANEYNLSELDYYRAVMGKTGVLIAASCEVGAIYAGGLAEEIEGLRSYGESLGAAFQIVDDLLDYQGDSEKTGKAVGNDLVEGKMTLPLILAQSRANDADQDRFAEIWADDKLRANSFSEIHTLIEKYNGFELGRLQAKEEVNKACAALDIWQGSSLLEKNILIDLAHYVLARKS